MISNKACADVCDLTILTSALGTQAEKVEKLSPLFIFTPHNSLVGLYTKSNTEL